MKQIIFIFMSLLCFSCSSKAQNQIADTNVQSDKKILVAYFSCTGTTEKGNQDFLIGLYISIRYLILRILSK